MDLKQAKLTRTGQSMLHDSYRQYYHDFTYQSVSTDQTYNITDWHILYSLNSKDDFRPACRNVGQKQHFFQNYPHPDNHSRRTTDTSRFTPFVVVCNLKSLSFNFMHMQTEFFSVFWPGRGRGKGFIGFHPAALRVLKLWQWTLEVLYHFQKYILWRP